MGLTKVGLPNQKGGAGEDEGLCWCLRLHWKLQGWGVGVGRCPDVQTDTCLIRGTVGLYVGGAGK